MMCHWIAHLLDELDSSPHRTTVEDSDTSVDGLGIVRLAGDRRQREQQERRHEHVDFGLGPVDFAWFEYLRDRGDPVKSIVAVG